MLNYTIIKFLININYFNFHAIIGDKVAAINEQNKRDWEIYDGAKSIGKITPNNSDLEKSGLGKNNNPAINPINIETYAFFSS